MTPSDLLLLTKARRYASSGAGRQIREQADLSIREVAAAIDLSPSALWRWECGARAPRGAAAVRWAQFLGDLEALPVTAVTA